VRWAETLAIPCFFLLNLVKAAEALLTQHSTPLEHKKLYHKSQSSSFSLIEMHLQFTKNI